jgi:hypothetical protein
MAATASKASKRFSRECGKLFGNTVAAIGAAWHGHASARLDSSDIQERGGDVSVACETSTRPTQGRTASEAGVFERSHSIVGKNKIGELARRAAGAARFWSTWEARLCCACCVTAGGSGMASSDAPIRKTHKTLAIMRSIVVAHVRLGINESSKELFPAVDTVGQLRLDDYILPDWRFCCTCIMNQVFRRAFRCVRRWFAPYFRHESERSKRLRRYRDGN